MRASEFLSNEEIKELSAPSDMRGLFAVATTWTMIGGAFALVVFFPYWWAYFVSIIILGGRHLALAILMHDCSHYSLFKTRSLNDFVGRWICGNPTWLDLTRYRKHHMRHHQYAGTIDDPDRDLVIAYPTTRLSLARKFARDLTGLSGLKRAYGLLLMDLGFIEFTVSSKVTPIDQSGRSARLIALTGIRNLRGMLISNSILFGILSVAGHPGLFALWIGAYFTTFSLILRIRSIAEHACTKDGLDPRNCTRTTYASLLARVTVAPHRVNFHLEHHVLMTVPYFRLPELHHRLLTRGKYTDAFIAKSYYEVLREAGAAN